MASFSQATLDLQKELKAAGFDPGPLDGIMGPRTRAAIDAREAAETETGVVEGNEAEGTPPDPAVAEGEAPTGMLAGGQVFKIGKPDGSPPSYYMAYKLPGTVQDWALFQFEDEAAVKAALGEEYDQKFFSEATFFGAEGSGQFTVVGEAGEVGGVTGTFQAYYDRVQHEALTAAGISDPSIRGQMLKDPEIAGLLTTVNLGSGADVLLTDDQMKAKLRNTNYWKETLYPGIEFFYKRGDAEPESAWKQYSANVADGLRQLGYQPDLDGSFKTATAELLNGGVADQEFNNFLPTALKIQQTPGLKAQFDAWSVRERGVETSFDEFVDILEGTSDPELANIVEKAELAYAAEQAGIQVSVDDIMALAADVDLTPQQALGAFTDLDRTLLAIGNQDLAGKGISKGDFLDVAAGRKPRSGISSGEVNRIGQQLIGERAAADDPSARFFMNFTSLGAPRRQGLGSVAPEGG